MTIQYAHQRTRSWQRRTSDRGRAQVLCPGCDQWFSPQGASAHYRMKHGGEDNPGPAPDADDARNPEALGLTDVADDNHRDHVAPQAPILKPRLFAKMQLILELQQVGQLFAEAATDARDAFFPSGEQIAVLELHDEIVLSGERLQGELTNTSDDPDDEASETHRAKLLIQLAFLVRCREATVAEHEKAAGFWSSLLGEETDTSELDAQIEWLREMVVTPSGDDPDGRSGDADAVDTETS